MRSPPPFLPALAAGAVIGVGAAAWPFTVDDAYVVARYATRIASGHGYTMNDGPPTDGVTGPLWLVPELAAAVLHVDPIVVAKGLGLALCALAAALVVARAARAQGGRVAAWLTVLLVALSPTLGVWGAAGLETGAATLALTIGALAATRRENGVREKEKGENVLSPLSLGLSIAALAWLRPECALASLCVLALMLFRSPPSGRLAVGVAAAGAVSVVVFRELMFGHALPMSLAAKPALPSHGIAYALRAALLALPAVGIVAALVVRRPRGWGRTGIGSDGALAVVVIVHVLAVVLAGGDWMPGFRLVAPVIPIGALLTARVVAHIARRRRALAMGVLLMSLGLPAVESVVAIPDAREAGQEREREGRELATWLRARSHRVALVDVGYLVRDLEVVDLGGITEPAVAYAPGGHLAKRIDEAWLRARAPDTIVLHGATRDLRGAWPVERRVASFSFVRSEYRVARVVRFAPAYWYVVLVRRVR